MSRLTVIIFSFLLGTPLLLWADCDCSDISLPESDLVVAGRVVNVEPNTLGGGIKYTLKVQGTWLGEADELIFIKSPWEHECGVTLRQDSSYVLFTYRKHTSRYTHFCYENRPYALAEDLFARLGSANGPRIQQRKMVRTTMWVIGGLGIGAVLFVAFVVLRKRIF